MAIHIEMIDDNYLAADILGIGIGECKENTYFFTIDQLKESEFLRNG